jgi:peroxin-19
VPSEDEFAKELQASMTNLISELDQNPDMQKEFEKMMQELIAAGAVSNDASGQQAEAGPAPTAPAAPSTAKPSAPSSSSSTAKKSGAPEDKFQDTIRRTMERMQASGDAATAASTSKQSQTSEDALLEQMMASLMEGNGSGEGGEGDFNTMLMSMMTQLTHKEILYEPMKELNDKFPAWMTRNAGTTPKDDLARFQKQQKLVGEIVGRFERSGYSDTNEADRDYIVERMQEMQSAGSPPEDLVGDMAAAQEALGDLDSSCPTQ